MLQGGRMQLVRDLLNIVGDLDRQLEQVVEVVLLTGSKPGILLLERLQADGDQRQALADVVVELARDVRPLLFLRGDQHAAHSFPLAFRFFLHRHVDAAADVAGEAAIRQVARYAAVEYPAVNAVRPTQAVLLLERKPGIERVEKCASCAIAIIWMDTLGPPKAAFLLQRPSRELEPLPVDVGALLVSIGQPDHDRHAVADRPESLFALAYPHFRFPAFRYVSMHEDRAGTM